MNIQKYSGIRQPFFLYLYYNKIWKRSLRTSNFRGKNKNNTSILHKYIVGILDKLTKSISINYYWNFELKFKTIFKKAFPFYILIDFRLFSEQPRIFYNKK